ncbi:hypothetical protein ACL9RI_04240 [Janthinobacterium sp. Mn2066]|uniref:hypothetical protein n=1 Tax=Janthinobacterium sp. Mn2066 TaxID=3395264 RepID=UPI003BDDBA90
MSGPVKSPHLPGMQKAAAAARPAPWWLAELHRLRPALLCAALTVAASVLLLGLSYRYADDQGDERELARQARATAANRFNQVETEKHDIRAYEPAFLALRQRGLVGEENRLAWIDAIRHSQEQRKLLPISYDISARQVLKVPPALAMGALQLRGTPMRLQMELLHEMDVLNLLDDLHQSGSFAVQDCNIKRNTSAATLSAECGLLWLTLGNTGTERP